MPFPDIDPVLVSINLFGFELALRWYALAYIAGLLLGWRFVVWLCRRPALWGGAAPMRAEGEAWRAYVADSLIETVLARDVLQMQTVAKPALLRHLFALDRPDSKGPEAD